MAGDPGLTGRAGLPGLMGNEGQRGERGEDGINLNTTPGPKGLPGDAGFPGRNGMFGLKVRNIYACEKSITLFDTAGWNWR